MPQLDPGLSRCLADWQASGPEAIQLRGDDLWTTPTLDDDTDLLMAPAAVATLLERARGWTTAGWCHTQVVTRRPHKTEVTLYALDGGQRVQLDVWRRLPQIDGGRRSLTFAGCRAACVPDDRGAGRAGLRLPPPIEARVYLHHLHAKRKNLAGGSVQTRLAGYAEALRAAGEDDLARRIEALRESATLDGALLAEASEGLDASLNPDGRLPSGLRGAWGRVFLSPPRKNRLVCVMGCDGAGKTTLAGALAARDPAIRGVFTGKHLYRKSYLFKLLVIFVRPLLGQSREGFDERLAPLVYLRACLGLRIKHWRGQRLLIDRALPDFLYRNRKTDRPRFSVWRGLMGWAGLRVPVVHCLVDFDRVAERKELEVTRAGHAAYNRDMFAALAGRTPSFYLAFNNDGTLEESVAALGRIMQHDAGWGAEEPE